MHFQDHIISSPSRHLIMLAKSFPLSLHPSSWLTFLFFWVNFLFCLRNFKVRCSRTLSHSWKLHYLSASYIYVLFFFPPFFLMYFLLTYVFSVHEKFFFLSLPPFLYPVSWEHENERSDLHVERVSVSQRGGLLFHFCLFFFSNS